MGMDDDVLIAAILTAGVLIRMPGSGTVSGDPQRDRDARAAEAVESYYSVLRALKLAKKAAASG
jgi:hypothetical protein